MIIIKNVRKGKRVIGRYLIQQEPGYMTLHSVYVAHTLMNIKLARTKNFMWLNSTSTLKHSPQTNVKEFSVH